MQPRQGSDAAPLSPGPALGSAGAPEQPWHRERSLKSHVSAVLGNFRGRVGRLAREANFLCSFLFKKEKDHGKELDS